MIDRLMCLRKRINQHLCPDIFFLFKTIEVYFSVLLGDLSLFPNYCRLACFRPFFSFKKNIRKINRKWQTAISTIGNNKICVDSASETSHLSLSLAHSLLDYRRGEHNPFFHPSNMAVSSPLFILDTFP